MTRIRGGCRRADPGGLGWTRLDRAGAGPAVSRPDAPREPGGTGSSFCSDPGAAFRCRDFSVFMTCLFPQSRRSFSRSPAEPGQNHEQNPTGPDSARRSGSVPGRPTAASTLQSFPLKVHSSLFQDFSLRESFQFSWSSGPGSGPVPGGLSDLLHCRGNPAATLRFLLFLWISG